MGISKNKYFLKAISLMLVGAFFVSDIAWAAPSENLKNLSFQAPITQILNDPSRLEVPDDFCVLKEIHQGQPGKPLIIHIQDAHANLSAQENLAGILKALITRYKINLILVEGGAVVANLDPLKKLTTAEIMNRAAKSMLVEGLIAGQEYLNLVTDYPMTLHGIEDMNLYFQSVDNYAHLASQRQQALDYLNQIQKALDKLKVRFYPKALLEYEQARQNEKVNSFESRFQALTVLYGEPLNGYSALNQLFSIIQREKDIKFDLANMEQALLIEKLGKNIHQELRHSHKNKALNHKNSQFAFYQNLLNAAREKNLDLNSYPNLLKYYEYLKQFATLDLDRVLDEIERFEDQVYKKILDSGSPQSRDSLIIRAIDRYLSILQTAYKIQMTTKDFQFFKANEPDFLTVNYQAFLNQKLAEQGFFEDLIAYKPILEQAKEFLVAFYDSVNQRDLAFMQNTKRILDDGSWIVDKKSSNNHDPRSTIRHPRAAVVIAGGYHTQHLTQLFKEQGYSYIVLAPNVTSETNQAKYEKQLLASIKNQPSQKMESGPDIYVSKKTEGVSKINAVYEPKALGAMLGRFATFSEAQWQEVLSELRSQTSLGSRMAGEKSQVTRSKVTRNEGARMADNDEASLSENTAVASNYLDWLDLNSLSARARNEISDFLNQTPALTRDAVEDVVRPLKAIHRVDRNKKILVALISNGGIVGIGAIGHLVAWLFPQIDPDIAKLLSMAGIFGVVYIFMRIKFKESSYGRNQDKLIQEIAEIEKNGVVFNKLYDGLKLNRWMDKRRFYLIRKTIAQLQLGVADFAHPSNDVLPAFFKPTHFSARADLTDVLTNQIAQAGGLKALDGPTQDFLIRFLENIIEVVKTESEKQAYFDEFESLLSTIFSSNDWKSFLREKRPNQGYLFKLVQEYSSVVNVKEFPTSSAKMWVAFKNLSQDESGARMAEKRSPEPRAPSPEQAGVRLADASVHSHDSEGPPYVLESVMGKGRKALFLARQISFTVTSYFVIVKIASPVIHDQVNNLFYVFLWVNFFMNIVWTALYSYRTLLMKKVVVKNPSDIPSGMNLFMATTIVPSREIGMLQRKLDSFVKLETYGNDITFFVLDEEDDENVKRMIRETTEKSKRESNKDVKIIHISRFGIEPFNQPAPTRYQGEPVTDLLNRLNVRSTHLKSVARFADSTLQGFLNTSYSVFQGKQKGGNFNAFLYRMWQLMGQNYGNEDIEKLVNSHTDDDQRQKIGEKLARILKEDKELVDKYKINPNFDLVTLMDLDHAPFPNFYAEILPPFKDKDLMFLQLPESFYNEDQNFVTRASSEERKRFYGFLHQTYLGLNMPVIVGAHTTFRREVFEVMGGYYPTHVTEDFLMMLKLRALKMKGIFLNKVVAVGEAPMNFPFYKRQQRRWAIGGLDQFLRDFPRLWKYLTWKEIIFFFGLLNYYSWGFISGVGKVVLYWSILSGQSLAVEPQILVKIASMSMFAVVSRYYFEKQFLIEPEKKSHFWHNMFMDIFMMDAHFVAFLKALFKPNINFETTFKSSQKDGGPKNNNAAQKEPRIYPVFKPALAGLIINFLVLAVAWIFYGGTFVFLNMLVWPVLTMSAVTFLMLVFHKYLERERNFQNDKPGKTVDSGKRIFMQELIASTAALAAMAPIVPQMIQMLPGAGAYRRSAAGIGTPAKVDIERYGERRFRLLVNGRERYLRGMGYNMDYSLLGVNSNVQGILERDFNEMKDLGINAVLNWGYLAQFYRSEEHLNEYTELLLDKSYKYLGEGSVVQGWWFNPRGNWLDENYRQSQMEKVLRYIRIHKDHPAILAWGLGNEVFLFSWSDAHRRAYALFFEELVKNVRQEDPNHPIVMKEANLDGLKWIKQYIPSFQKYGIYGINGYEALTKDLGMVASGLDEYRMALPEMPTLVSEYGPPGWWVEDSAPDERMYLDQWSEIFSARGHNLGGFAFAFGYSEDAHSREMDHFALHDRSGTPKPILRELRKLWKAVPSDGARLAENYYDVLGIRNKNAGQDEISRAYQRIRNANYEDWMRKGASQQAYNSLLEAYFILGNPQLRKKFDEQGLSGITSERRQIKVFLETLDPYPQLKFFASFNSGMDLSQFAVTESGNFAKVFLNPKSGKFVKQARSQDQNFEMLEEAGSLLELGALGKESKVPQLLRIEMNESGLLRLHLKGVPGGRNLRQAWGSLTSAQRLQVFIQTADILGRMAQLDVVHNDVKPENIIVDGSGNVMLIDFGRSGNIGSKRRAGTLNYASNELRLFPGIDVYSLGKTITELTSNVSDFELAGSFLALTNEMTVDSEINRPDWKQVQQKLADIRDAEPLSDASGTRVAESTRIQAVEIRRILKYAEQNVNKDYRERHLQRLKRRMNRFVENVYESKGLDGLDLLIQTFLEMKKNSVPISHRFALAQFIKIIHDKRFAYKAEDASVPVGSEIGVERDAPLEEGYRLTESPAIQGNATANREVVPTEENSHLIRAPGLFGRVKQWWEDNGGLLVPVVFVVLFFGAILSPLIKQKIPSVFLSSPKNVYGPTLEYNEYNSSARHMRIMSLHQGSTQVMLPSTSSRGPGIGGGVERVMAKIKGVNARYFTGSILNVMADGGVLRQQGQLKLIPQGKETGEEIQMTVLLPELERGHKPISLENILNGTIVPFEDDSVKLDENGTFRVKKKISSQEFTYSIRLRDKNSVVFQNNSPVTPWMEKEFADIPSVIRNKLDVYKNASAREKASVITQLMKEFYAYARYKNVHLASGTWMRFFTEQELDHLSKQNDSGFKFAADCYPLAAFQFLFSRYLGLDTVLLAGYANNEDSMLTAEEAHVFMYVRMEQDEWEIFDITGFLDAAETQQKPDQSGASYPANNSAASAQSDAPQTSISDAPSVASGSVQSPSRFAKEFEPVEVSSLQTESLSFVKKIDPLGDKPKQTTLNSESSWSSYRALPGASFDLAAKDIFVKERGRSFHYPEAYYLLMDNAHLTAGKPDFLPAGAEIIVRPSYDDYWKMDSAVFASSQRGYSSIYRNSQQAWKEAYRLALDSEKELLKMLGRRAYRARFEALKSIRSRLAARPSAATASVNRLLIRESIRQGRVLDKQFRGQVLPTIELRRQEKFKPDDFLPLLNLIIQANQAILRGPGARLSSKMGAFVLSALLWTAQLFGLPQSWKRVSFSVARLSSFAQIGEIFQSGIPMEANLEFMDSRIRPNAAKMVSDSRGNIYWIDKLYGLDYAIYRMKSGQTQREALVEPQKDEIPHFAVSEDGKFIIYVEGGSPSYNLKLIDMQSDPKNSRTLRVMDHYITPVFIDSSRVAFSHDDGQGISVLNLETGLEEILPGTSTLHSISSLNSDGRGHLVYLEAPPFQFPLNLSIPVKASIYLYDLETNTRTYMGNAGLGAAPSIKSGLVTWMSYGSAHEQPETSETDRKHWRIYVYDLRTAETRLISPLKLNNGQAVEQDSTYPDMDPQGRFIVYLRRAWDDVFLHLYFLENMGPFEKGKTYFLKNFPVFNFTDGYFPGAGFFIRLPVEQSRRPIATGRDLFFQAGRGQRLTRINMSDLRPAPLLTGDGEKSAEQGVDKAQKLEPPKGSGARMADGKSQVTTSQVTSKEGGRMAEEKEPQTRDRGLQTRESKAGFSSDVSCLPSPFSVSGSRAALAVNLSPISYFNHQNTGVFPVEDRAVVAYSKTIDFSFFAFYGIGVMEGVGCGAIVFDLFNNNSLDFNRKLSEFFIRLFRKTVSDHLKPRRFSISREETVPDRRDFSSFLQKAGADNSIASNRSRKASSAIKKPLVLSPFFPFFSETIRTNPLRILSGWFFSSPIRAIFSFIISEDRVMFLSPDKNYNTTAFGLPQGVNIWLFWLTDMFSTVAATDVSSGLTASNVAGSPITEVPAGMSGVAGARAAERVSGAGSFYDPAKAQRAHEGAIRLIRRASAPKDMANEIKKWNLDRDTLLMVQDIINFSKYEVEILGVVAPENFDNSPKKIDYHRFKQEWLLKVEENSYPAILLKLTNSSPYLFKDLSEADNLMSVYENIYNRYGDSTNEYLMDEYMRYAQTQTRLNSEEAFRYFSKRLNYQVKAVHIFYDNAVLSGALSWSMFEDVNQVLRFADLRGIVARGANRNLINKNFLSKLWNLILTLFGLRHYTNDENAYLVIPYKIGVSTGAQGLVTHYRVIGYPNASTGSRMAFAISIESKRDFVQKLLKESKVSLYVRRDDVPSEAAWVVAGLSANKKLLVTIESYGIKKVARIRKWNSSNLLKLKFLIDADEGVVAELDLGQDAFIDRERHYSYLFQDGPGVVQMIIESLESGADYEGALKIAQRYVNVIDIKPENRFLSGARMAGRDLNHKIWEELGELNRKERIYFLSETISKLNRQGYAITHGDAQELTNYWNNVISEIGRYLSNKDVGDIQFILNRAIENVRQHVGPESEAVLLIRLNKINDSAARFEYLVIDTGDGFVDGNGNRIEIKEAVYGKKYYKGHHHRALGMVFDSADALQITEVHTKKGNIEAFQFSKTGDRRFTENEISPPKIYTTGTMIHYTKIVNPTDLNHLIDVWNENYLNVGARMAFGPSSNSTQLNQFTISELIEVIDNDTMMTFKLSDGRYVVMNGATVYVLGLDGTTKDILRGAIYFNIERTGTGSLGESGNRQALSGRGSDFARARIKAVLEEIANSDNLAGEKAEISLTLGEYGRLMWNLNAALLLTKGKLFNLIFGSRMAGEKSRGTMSQVTRAEGGWLAGEEGLQARDRGRQTRESKAGLSSAVSSPPSPVSASGSRMAEEPKYIQFAKKLGTSSDKALVKVALEIGLRNADNPLSVVEAQTNFKISELLSMWGFVGDLSDSAANAYLSSLQGELSNPSMIAMLTLKDEQLAKDIDHDVSSLFILPEVRKNILDYTGDLFPGEFISYENVVEFLHSEFQLSSEWRPSELEVLDWVHLVVKRIGSLKEELVNAGKWQEAKPLTYREAESLIEELPADQHSDGQGERSASEILAILNRVLEASSNGLGFESLPDQPEGEGARERFERIMRMRNTRWELSQSFLPTYNLGGSGLLDLLGDRIKKNNGSLLILVSGEESVIANDPIVQTLGLRKDLFVPVAEIDLDVAMLSLEETDSKYELYQRSDGVHGIKITPGARAATVTIAQIKNFIDSIISGHQLSPDNQIEKFDFRGFRAFTSLPSGDLFQAALTMLQEGPAKSTLKTLYFMNLIENIDPNVASTLNPIARFEVSGMMPEKFDSYKGLVNRAIKRVKTSTLRDKDDVLEKLEQAIKLLPAGARMAEEKSHGTTLQVTRAEGGWLAGQERLQTRDRGLQTRESKAGFSSDVSSPPSPVSASGARMAEVFSGRQINKLFDALSQKKLQKGALVGIEYKNNGQVIEYKHATFLGVNSKYGPKKVFLRVPRTEQGSTPESTQVLMIDIQAIQKISIFSNGVQNTQLSSEGALVRAPDSIEISGYTSLAGIDFPSRLTVRIGSETKNLNLRTHPEEFLTGLLIGHEIEYLADGDELDIYYLGNIEADERGYVYVGASGIREAADSAKNDDPVKKWWLSLEGNYYFSRRLNLALEANHGLFVPSLAEAELNQIKANSSQFLYLAQSQWDDYHEFVELFVGRPSTELAIYEKSALDAFNAYKTLYYIVSLYQGRWIEVSDYDQKLRPQVTRGLKDLLYFLSKENFLIRELSDVPAEADLAKEFEDFINQFKGYQFKYSQVPANISDLARIFIDEYPQLSMKGTPANQALAGSRTAAVEKQYLPGDSIDALESDALLSAIASFRHQSSSVTDVEKALSSIVSALTMIITIKLENKDMQEAEKEELKKYLKGRLSILNKVLDKLLKMESKVNLYHQVSTAAEREAIISDLKPELSSFATTIKAYDMNEVIEKLDFLDEALKKIMVSVISQSFETAQRTVADRIDLALRTSSVPIKMNANSISANLRSVAGKYGQRTYGGASPKIVLKENMGESGIELNMPEIRFASLISNLLGNALLHGDVSRQIIVNSDIVDEKSLVLSVTNMSAQPLSESFFDDVDGVPRFARTRFEESDQRIHIGLAEVWRIVRLIGGEIAIESKPANDDLYEIKFTVKMPVSSGAPATEKAGSRTAEGSRLTNDLITVATQNPLKVARENGRIVLELNGATENITGDDVAVLPQGMNDNDLADLIYSMMDPSKGLADGKRVVRDEIGHFIVNKELSFSVFPPRQGKNGALRSGRIFFYSHQKRGTYESAVDMYTFGINAPIIGEVSLVERKIGALLRKSYTPNFMDNGPFYWLGYQIEKWLKDGEPTEVILNRFSYKAIAKINVERLVEILNEIRAVPEINQNDQVAIYYIDDNFSPNSSPLLSIDPKDEVIPRTVRALIDRLKDDRATYINVMLDDSGGINIAKAKNALATRVMRVEDPKAGFGTGSRLPAGRQGAAGVKENLQQTDGQAELAGVRLARVFAVPDRESVGSRDKADLLSATSQELFAAYFLKLEKRALSRFRHNLFSWNFPAIRRNGIVVLDNSDNRNVVRVYALSALPSLLLGLSPIPIVEQDLTTTVSRLSSQIQIPVPGESTPTDASRSLEAFSTRDILSQALDISISPVNEFRNQTTRVLTAQQAAVSAGIMDLNKPHVFVVDLASYVNQLTGYERFLKNQINSLNQISPNVSIFFIDGTQIDGTQDLDQVMRSIPDGTPVSVITDQPTGIQANVLNKIKSDAGQALPNAVRALLEQGKFSVQTIPPLSEVDAGVFNFITLIVAGRMLGQVDPVKQAAIPDKILSFFSYYVPGAATFEGGVEAAILELKTYNSSSDASGVYRQLSMRLVPVVWREIQTFITNLISTGSSA